MRKRVIRGAIAASVSAAIIGGCIFMMNGGKGGVDVNAASMKAESVVSESTEIPSEYPSEAVYLHFKADLQKQKDGQEAWKKAQVEKKAAEDKKKADAELAAKEKAANDAMQAVWDFPNGCLRDGATRDMLADAQAKIEALPDGNATKDALYPAIAAADNAFTVIENQQKAAEQQKQQTQQQSQSVSDSQVQQMAQEISYNTIDATSIEIPETFDQSGIDSLDPALQPLAWTIVNTIKAGQGGVVYVGDVTGGSEWTYLDGDCSNSLIGQYFGITDDVVGYSLCDENGERNFFYSDDDVIHLYMTGGDAAYNNWQAHRQKIAQYQQIAGQVPVDDAGKVQAINAKVCQLLTYDNSYSVYDADTALATGTGVCDAYANLFHRLATACGLQDRVCVGPANGSGGWGLHAWNQTLVNGQWLYTDSTWNDCLGSNQYLMSAGLWSDHQFQYYE